MDNIDALRAYQDEIDQHGYLNNNRIKLLLLGNGRVGKTTLAYALTEQAAQKDKILESPYSPCSTESHQFLITSYFLLLGALFPQYQATFAQN